MINTGETFQVLAICVCLAMFISHGHKKYEAKKEIKKPEKMIVIEGVTSLDSLKIDMKVKIATIEQR
jgi:hypothetical protein